MLAAARDMTLTELAMRVNDLQAKAGYNKRLLKRAAMYRYDKVQPPSDRAYAMAAVLNIHPKKLFKDVYDDEKYEYYKSLRDQVCGRDPSDEPK